LLNITKSVYLVLLAASHAVKFALPFDPKESAQLAGEWFSTGATTEGILIVLFLVRTEYAPSTDPPGSPLTCSWAFICEFGSGLFSICANAFKHKKTELSNRIFNILASLENSGLIKAS